MERTVVWGRVDRPGTEILRLRADEKGIAANGNALSVDEAGEPFELRYSLSLDPAWQVRRLLVLVTLGDVKRTLSLRAEPGAGWRTHRGRRLPQLDDCLDADLSATPFTNTPPLRRLHLPVGAAREIAVAYVEVPSLQVARRVQRYTHLQSSSNSDRYLFESLERGFRAELLVDADGLVMEYPGLFVRPAPPGPSPRISPARAFGG